MTTQQIKNLNNLKLLNCLNLFNYNYKNIRLIYLNNENYFINFCKFEDCHSAENGGAIYIENMNSLIIFLNSLFLNCSASSSGGSFKTYSFEIKIENCCSIKCHIFNKVSWYWGHGGSSDANKNINISLNSIIYCSNKFNNVGYIGFSIRYGNQYVNKINYSDNSSPNTWSGFNLATCEFSNLNLSTFQNITGYEAICCSHKNILPVNIYFCNLINNPSIIGSINAHNQNINVFNCLFLKNLINLGIQTNNNYINCYDSITDLNSFNTGNTINCLTSIINTNSYNILNFNNCKIFETKMISNVFKKYHLLIFQIFLK